MILRNILVPAAATVLFLAACQSVHTQNPPARPSLDAPVSLSLNPAAAPSIAPAATASPTAVPARLVYNSVTGAGRTVALTFDDGPSPKLTPELLDMLKKRGVKATFFVIGQNAAAYPEILQRMVAEGHEVANHSWSHPALNKLGASGVASQIEKTNAAIRSAIGRDPVVMRPPYGATNASLNRRFNEQWGLKVIMWDVDPLDWKYRNAARVEREILSATRPGSIILVHDIHASSVAAMPGTIDKLLAQGYKFATVSELIAMEGSQAVPVSAPVSKPSPAASPAPAAITAPVPPPSASPAYSVERYEAAATPTP